MELAPESKMYLFRYLVITSKIQRRAIVEIYKSPETLKNAIKKAKIEGTNYTG